MKSRVGGISVKFIPSSSAAVKETSLSGTMLTIVSVMRDAVCCGETGIAVDGVGSVGGGSAVLVVFQLVPHTVHLF